MFVDTDHRTAIFLSLSIPLACHPDVVRMQTPDPLQIVDKDAYLRRGNFANDVPAFAAHLLVLEVGSDDNDVEGRKFRHGLLAAVIFVMPLM